MITEHDMQKTKDAMHRAQKLFRLHTSFGLSLLQAEDTFERNCKGLHVMVGGRLPYERLKEIVLEIAYQSTHPNHTVPGHLVALLRNKRILENTPTTQSIEQMIALYPVDCAERCLTKFVALLGKAEVE
jgi:hypothetical protein